MDYQRYFVEAVSGLKTEGRYRVFADLERRAGSFPQAKRHGPNGVERVTVWRSALLGKPKQCRLRSR